MTAVDFPWCFMVQCTLRENRALLFLMHSGKQALKKAYKIKELIMIVCIHFSHIFHYLVSRFFQPKDKSPDLKAGKKRTRNTMNQLQDIFYSL